MYATVALRRPIHSCPQVFISQFKSVLSWGIPHFGLHTHTHTLHNINARALSHTHSFASSWLACFLIASLSPHAGRSPLGPGSPYRGMQTLVGMDAGVHCVQCRWHTRCHASTGNVFSALRRACCCFRTHGVERKKIVVTNPLPPLRPDGCVVGRAGTVIDQSSPPVSVSSPGFSQVGCAAWMLTNPSNFMFIV